MKRILTLVILILFFFVDNVFAQNDFKSEDDLKEKAAELFEEEKFVEAEPLYAQLLSLYPKDATYNYKYGACLIAADEDKSKPLSFLEFAVSKSGVDPEAYYYLGKANHLNYNFGKAVKHYSRFKTKASSEQQEKFQIDRQIEMCKNGNQLLSKLNEVQVINREVVSEENFFRLYELEGINGKLIAKPEEFNSKYDQKVNEKSVIYLPDDATEVYYSSYGKKAQSGRDIYKSIKLGTGGWSEGVNIGESINTPYDENYPFIHPDGKTLYFSSKGHSSMGGYDLFKSEFDVSTGQWGTPENLDFAFCSTDDDLLFVTDKNKVTAYFASNRSNAKGKFTVYKVLVDRKPIELSVIQGKFIAENNPELQKATITVIDKETNKTIGVYETNNKGEYKLEIEKNGGTYQFNIETTDDAPIHTGVVKVPKQDEFEILGQELRLVGEGDEQQLVIKNIFDGSTAQNLNTGGPQVSANVLRAKANLDVNFSTSELAALESDKEESTSQETDGGATAENTTTGNNLGTSKAFSPEAVVLRNSYAEKQASQKQLVDEKGNKVNIAYAEAIALKDEATAAFSTLNELKNSSASSEEIKQQKQTARETALKAAFTAEAAQELEQDLKEDKKVLKELDQEEEAFDGLLQRDELAEAELKLEALSRAQAKSIDSETKITNLIEAAKEELRVTESALSSSKAKLKTLEAEKLEVSDDISQVENSISNAKGDKKQALEIQLEGLSMDLKDLDYQAQKTQEEINAQENEKKALAIKNNQLAQTKSALASSTSTAVKIEEAEKVALINQLKTYRENNQLAYLDGSEVDTTPTSSASLSSSDSDVEVINQLDEKFNAELVASEGIQDVDLRNARKIQVYDNWINELEAEMIENEAEIAGVKTEVERNRLQNDIAAMQLVIDQKTILRDQAEEKAVLGGPVANALDPEVTDVANIGIGNSGDDDYEELNPEVPQSVSEVDDLSLIPDDFTNFKFDQSIKFGNQRPSQVMGLAKKALFEAREQSLKSEEARQQAYTLPTAEERAAAFERANEFENESERKQLEAAAYFAQYNKTEYEINRRRLFNANQFEDEFESDALDLANLLAEEGQVYFNDAAQIRREIDPDDRLSQKEVLLQKAYDYEVLALEKQRQAFTKLSLADDQLIRQENLENAENQPAFVQTITDAQVLNVEDANVAKQRADSLYASVETLEAEAKQKLNESENLPAGEERNEAVVEYEEALAKVEENKTKAAIYYERKKQLESGSTSGKIRFAEPADGLTAPAYKSFKNETVLDTVVIEEERKNQLLSSKAFVEYQKSKQNRDRIAKDASTEYAVALKLSEEKQQLQKQATIARNQAELETKKTEKQRLIKTAEVIDQQVARKQVEIDSLNTSIKVKNYLISTSDQNMKAAVADLDEKEKKEIMQLARTAQAPKALADKETVENTPTPEVITPSNEEITQSNEEIEVPAVTDTEPAKDEVVDLDETPAVTATPNETVNTQDNTVEEVENTPIAEAIESNTGSSNSALATIDNVPRQLKEAIFITLQPNEAAYSRTKPIPVNTDLPEGLVYKVQVGAFRNPIPQDLFKGFAPLYAEKIPSGITRYTAGLFAEESSATRARNEIRQLGYPDAFVVAFLNGKRISIAQARGGAAAPTAQTPGGATSDAITSGSATPSNQGLSSQFNSTEVEPVVNANSVNKVYYTVQIGVYSKPLKKGTFDFEDLNVVELPNGLIRYNAGIYDSVIKAAEVKNAIQSEIPDAFVTAYEKGTRLSLNEASKLKNAGR